MCLKAVLRPDEELDDGEDEAEEDGEHDGPNVEGMREVPCVGRALTSLTPLLPARLYTRHTTPHTHTHTTKW